ncbi:hypothetical protein RHGRI_012206 [Rhododendron griersonianum]|uniref:Uncharacterized protein n=1 Tax=Rhododendron griersonianum TaxID=479676 RepID=A0AAV6KPX2_9ERIC|nr:hypothetical protein RHGRI_012202 [Rhododendron griersonianum]KAG5554565.1 hypothetical protein RHGRI_012206 [Rhododendron griersonianum]
MRRLTQRSEDGNDWVLGCDIMMKIGSTSTGPATRSKAKATDIVANQRATPKVNPTKVPPGKRRGVATLAAEKEEEGSEKLPSNFESSMSASSPLPTHSVSDADSSSGLRSGSSPSSPKRSESPNHSESSYSVAMQAMTTGAATVEEQLSNMARAIEKLTKTVEDKDLQIASLMNKLEAQNMGGTSHDASHPPGFTPKGVIIADQSGKLMMGDQTEKLKQTDDGNHVLSSNQGDGHKSQTLYAPAHPHLEGVLSAKNDDRWILVPQKKSIKRACKTPPHQVKKWRVKKVSPRFIEKNEVNNEKDKEETLHEKSFLTPITLHDFFPEEYFEDNCIGTVYMVSADEEVEDNINQSFKHRVSVFDRIEAPTARTSVFERLDRVNQEIKKEDSQQRRSAFSRLQDTHTKSKAEQKKRKVEEALVDSTKEDEETRSSIPSRMKRVISLEVSRDGPLKVKRHTIILTKPKESQVKGVKKEQVISIVP